MKGKIIKIEKYYVLIFTNENGENHNYRFTKKSDAIKAAKEMKIEL